jgi:hypothetical protein
MDGYQVPGLSEIYFKRIYHEDESGQACFKLDQWFHGRFSNNVLLK